jgi:KDO2-lipid IV(A) lauroyltransferase
MRQLLDLIGASLATLAYWLGFRRNVTDTNLRLALPNLSKREANKIALGSYRNLGRVFAEMLYLRFASREAFKRNLHLSNPEVLESALASGHGVLILSGHLSNWEWGGIGFNLFLHKPFYLVVKNQTKGFAEHFVSAMRKRFGGTLVNAGDVMALYRALQKGEAVSMLTDQAAPSESTRVEFFGRLVPTFEGAARLALRTRAEMIFYAPTRLHDGKYSVRFDRIDYSDLSGSSDENVWLLTERHTQALERAIREHPSEWLWQHKRWKHATT